MSSTERINKPHIPLKANFVAQGSGTPVVMIHGLAASLHDWDALAPALVRSGYSSYAVDLLGHGDSAKPDVPLYEMDWLVDHFVEWMHGLQLDTLPVIVGHSLGGYVALEYARRFPDATRGLVLVNPFYSNGQLPRTLRLAYAHPGMSSFFMRNTPAWLVRSAIDVTSLLMGHSKGGLHALPAAIREQTALDYMRTSPAAYGILKSRPDLSPYLKSIDVPALVVWGEHDRTLSPASFIELVRRLPRATGASSRTGHVPHQADAEWFNERVISFLHSLEGGEPQQPAPQTMEHGITESLRKS